MADLLHYFTEPSTLQNFIEGLKCLGINVTIDDDVVTKDVLEKLKCAHDFELPSPLTSSHGDHEILMDTLRNFINGNTHLLFISGVNQGLSQTLAELIAQVSLRLGRRNQILRSKDFDNDGILSQIKSYSSPTSHTSCLGILENVGLEYLELISQVSHGFKLIICTETKICKFPSLNSEKGGRFIDNFSLSNNKLNIPTGEEFGKLSDWLVNKFK